MKFLAIDACFFAGHHHPEEDKWKYYMFVY